MTKERLNNAKRHIIMFIINSFFCGTHYYKIKAFLIKSAGAKMGKNVRVVGPLFWATHLSIGDNTFIGREFSIYGNGKVVIGRNCDLGPAVSLVTGSHEIGTTEHRAGKGISYSIQIQDGCWIGARATILGNTTVDKGAVIACGSVVNKDVKTDSLYGGVPAKIIRDL